MDYNILNTAVTMLSVIGAYAPVKLLTVLYHDGMNEVMPYRSLFNRAEYIYDKAAKNLDSANSKLLEAQTLAKGSNDLASLSRKYTEDIHDSVV